MEAELREIEAQSAALQLEGQAAIDEYRQLRSALADAEARIAAAIQQPDHALAFLRPGRLIRVREGMVSDGSKRRGCRHMNNTHAHE